MALLPPDCYKYDKQSLVTMNMSIDIDGELVKTRKTDTPHDCFLLCDKTPGCVYFQFHTKTFIGTYFSQANYLIKKL